MATGPYRKSMVIDKRDNDVKMRDRRPEALPFQVVLQRVTECVSLSNRAIEQRRFATNRVRITGVGGDFDRPEPLLRRFQRLMKSQKRGPICRLVVVGAAHRHLAIFSVLTMISSEPPRRNYRIFSVT